MPVMAAISSCNEGIAPSIHANLFVSGSTLCIARPTEEILERRTGQRAPPKLQEARGRITGQIGQCAIELCFSRRFWKSITKIVCDVAESQLDLAFAGSVLYVNLYGQWLQFVHKSAGARFNEGLGLHHGYGEQIIGWKRIEIPKQFGPDAGPNGNKN